VGVSSRQGLVLPTMTTPTAAIIATLVCLPFGVAGCASSPEEHRPGASPNRQAPDRRSEALGLTSALPSTYRRLCAQQRSIAPPAARPCPPLIPDGELDVETAGRFSKQKRYRGGYTASLASCSLNRLNGRHIETNGCHWLYEVAWTAPVRRLIRAGVQRPPNASEASSCGRVDIEAQAMYACRVMPFDEGGSMHGGHIAHLWPHGDVVYVVSLHGHRNEPRARAMIAALAKAVLAASPRRPSGPS
jgi:hypothetical protein